MAHSKNNIITHGLSGMLASQVVFRQRAGKTIVAKAPAINENFEPSDTQLATQKRFKLAVLYGKAVVADPAKKAIYEEKATAGQSAFNVAFADYFNMPEIGEIDTSTYLGQVGDKIKALVTDDFKVASVKVSIFKPDGSILEEGNAQVAANGSDWEYLATVANAALAGCKVRYEARDIPDNVTTKEKVL